MRSDAKRLNDILKAIIRIEGLSAQGEGVFRENLIVQEAMLYNFHILGEAANNVSKELQAANPDVDWLSMGTMRNFLIHEYWRIVLDIVWKTATENVPELKPQIEAIIAAL